MSSYSPELIDSCRETRVTRFKSLCCPAKSQRANNSKALRICCTVLFILSAGLGIAYLLFDPLVRSVILNKLTLSNTSDTFYIWEDPPILPHFKVYFWNLSNPEDFFSGKSKPVLQEIGPYTYRQKWIKQNISWNGNGTISYRTRKILRFTPEESCAGCNSRTDLITTANVPVISAYDQMKDHNMFSRALLELAVNGLDHRPWTRRTVDEFLWGYEEKLLEMAQYFPNPPPFKHFGFFLTKNSSRDEDLGLYEMFTGEGDPYKLATISAVNGKQRLGVWSNFDCDRVHGSDGASFNPYIQERDTLWFFNDQLCRSMPLTFNQSVEHKGLKSYRFVPRKDVFMPQTHKEENKCFVDDGKVVGDGVFDVTICQFNAPIVLSWPHFLHADQKYVDGVEGLSANPADHGFWFDIQPITGTTLSAKARIQVNVQVRNMEGFADMAHVKSTLLPTLWFEEGIDELGDEIVEVLKTAALHPIQYRLYILYCFLGVLVVTVSLGLVVCVNTCNHKGGKELEKVREQVHDMLTNSQQDKVEVVQPMLEHYQDSTDSSRVTTATHSRNCSEGTRPPYINEFPCEKQSNNHLPPYFNSMKKPTLSSLKAYQEMLTSGHTIVTSVETYEQDTRRIMVPDLYDDEDGDEDSLQEQETEEPAAEYQPPAQPLAGPAQQQRHRNISVQSCRSRSSRYSGSSAADKCPSRQSPSHLPHIAFVGYNDEDDLQPLDVVAVDNEDDHQLRTGGNDDDDSCEEQLLPYSSSLNRSQEQSADAGGSSLASTLSADIVSLAQSI